MSDAGAGPALTRQWRASPRPAERAAARIAAELAGRQRWDPVDGTVDLAARLDLPAGTVRAAKVLLAGNGVIMKSAGRPLLGRVSGAFAEVWVDAIRLAHGELPPDPPVTYARPDGSLGCARELVIELPAARARAAGPGPVPAGPVRG